MSAPSSDDNAREPGLRLGVDPHGQAALLLVESLIHGLITQRHLSVETAIEIIDVAFDVARATEDELAQPPAGRKASVLLLAMRKSLGYDLPKASKRVERDPLL